jgi:malate dehydrogenase
MRNKVTIVGSGNVGATAAHWIASKELADVVLIDIIEGVPQGKGLDLLEAMPIEKRDSCCSRHERLRRHGQLRHRRHHRRNSAQAGHEPRRSSEYELQDHERRGRQGRTALAELHSHYRLQSARRHGAGRLQDQRISASASSAWPACSTPPASEPFIAQELKVSVENVNAFVLGGHGDTMVPLPRYSTVAGIPITELLDKATLDRIVQRTRDGGAEIVKYLKTGSAYYAPSAAATEMVEAILKDKKKILPCAAYLNGEYGEYEASRKTLDYVGVPVNLVSQRDRADHRDQT